MILPLLTALAGAGIGAGAVLNIAKHERRNAKRWQERYLEQLIETRRWMFRRRRVVIASPATVEEFAPTVVEVEP